MQTGKKQPPPLPTSRLIFTVAIGNLDYFPLTIPRMRCYAAQNSADFLVIDKLTPGYPTPKHHFLDGFHFAAQQQYDQILYLDADIFIVPNADSIFTDLKLPSTAPCAYLREDTAMYQYFPADYPKWLAAAQSHLQFTPPARPYFNGGVIYCNNAFANTFRQLFHEPWLIGYEDQHQLNYILSQFSISLLPPAYNRYAAPVPWRETLSKSNFSHYSTPTGQRYLSTISHIPTIPDRHELAKFLAHRPTITHNPTWAEIGVRTGNFSQILAGHRPPNTNLLLIDSWQDWPKDIYPEENLPTESEYHQQYLSVITRFASDPTISVIRLPSLHAAAALPEESLEFVYIDANHTLPSITADLDAWHSRLAPGGILAGHDYVDLDSWCLVKTAVDKFAAHHQYPIHLTREPAFPSWFIVKQDN